MYQNILRHGNFTSSKIVALTTSGKTKGSWGKPALTYIAEKNMERRLQQSLNTETRSNATAWGKLCERMVDRMLGLEYRFSSDITYMHPEISSWAGSPDAEKFDQSGVVDTEADAKCPFTKKSFCQLVDPLYEGLTGLAAMQRIRDEHSDGEDYYWQLVSNACIRKARYAELIVFMPYESQLDEIRLLADGEPNCYFIANALPGELPFLLDGGYYKNLNKIRFEVPEEDKAFLTNRVIEASKLLIPPFASGLVSDPTIACYDPEVKATIVDPADNRETLS